MDFLRVKRFLLSRILWIKIDVFSKKVYIIVKMNADNLNYDKRKEQRVKMPYVIKFRPQNASQGSGGWDAINPINISKTGICFYTTKQYEPGLILEMLVSNPRLLQESVYLSTVIRSRPSEKLKIFYETVVSIDAIEEDVKKSFYAAIEDFVRQKPSGA